MPHPADDKTDHHHPPWLTNNGQHTRTETGEKEPRWGSPPLTTDLTNTESRCHVTVGNVATKRSLLYLLQFHGEYPPHRPPFDPPQQHRQRGNAKSPGTTAEGDDLAHQQTCHVVTVHISPGVQPLLPTLSSVHTTTMATWQTTMAKLQHVSMMDDG